MRRLVNRLDTFTILWSRNTLRIGPKTLDKLLDVCYYDCSERSGEYPASQIVERIGVVHQMATKQELEIAVNEATAKLEEAVKSFEAMRAKGTAADLVKSAGLVTNLTKLLTRAQREHETFALVGIYEGIKAEVLKIRFDTKTLLAHQVEYLNIQVPFGDAGVDVEKIVVNTLGRKTRVASTGGGGGGGRAKYEMRNDDSGETMTPRDFLEQFGEDALGDVAGKVLAEPSRYGLVDYAARAGAKVGWSKVEIAAS